MSALETSSQALSLPGASKSKIEASAFSNTERWLIIIAVMSATIMQVLDTTIINVALPHMQGSLGAAPDQISWTLTSYLVASAIFMPLTGYLSDKIGQKKYLLICIAGFTLVSSLCGAATSLTEIIVFRMLQGIFGAGLVPLSQSIMGNVYSGKERNKGTAIWGMGVMIAPILGPTLGGYLTDIASWRWTFYVNVPIGILAFFLAWQVVPDSDRKERRMDWIGLVLISLAIGATQYVLDRGSQVDWFSSDVICVATVLAIGGLIGFLLHSLPPGKQMVFDIRIFADRNFTLSCLILLLLGTSLYGVTVLLPLLLENLLNYPVSTTGLVLAPRGIASLLSIVVVGRLAPRLGTAGIMILGILFTAAGTWLSTYYSVMISPGWATSVSMVQGFGLGMVFYPIITVAFATLPTRMHTEAAGLFSLVRVLSGSIGISMTMSLLTNYGQVSWNRLGGFINPYNPALYQYLEHLGLKPTDAQGAALLSGELLTQTQMVAFINVFAVIALTLLLILPLVLLLRGGKHAPLEGSATLLD
ncbi:MAG TPA: DHA2 family efflux MFS transporter permease subunit [Gammaproteobacteria bacterium]|nr:DHA2 family efflux MFS transporter permease subunit [Gammaproteobacteria bacterium]